MQAKGADRVRWEVRAAVVLAAAVMLIAGVWCWVDPTSFAAWASWPPHAHFLHDAGVFQMAIGVMLLCALWWRDVLAVVLVGAVFANGMHALNHAMDLDLGGRASDPWLLAGIAVVCLAGLVVRVRSLRGRAALADAGSR
jgi:hypothetical protein